MCKNNRRAWRAIKGFTLLEVLVALIIIGVALAAAMRGTLSLINTSEDIKHQLLATLTAENTLLELRLSRTQLTLGDTQSDCAQGGLMFTCRQLIQPTPNPFFRRVQLTVTKPVLDGQGQAIDQRRLAEMMTVLPTYQ